MARAPIEMAEMPQKPIGPRLTARYLIAGSKPAAIYEGGLSSL
jgi:hypothetical protein